jgi:TctA family transporter
LVFLFTGFFGLGLAFLCTIIGLLPIMSGVSRTHLMGVLLIPTISYFLF